MSLVLDIEYLEHSGGTKFYETVRLTDANTDKSILIKRWGAMGVKQGGGQCKIERGNGLSTRSAARRIINEKERNGYNSCKTMSGRRPSSGFYALSEGVPLIDSSVFDAINVHWASKDVRDAVLDFFPELTDAVLRPPGVAAAPKAVPWDKQDLDRGESWGVF